MIDRVEHTREWPLLRRHQRCLSLIRRPAVRLDRARSKNAPFTHLSPERMEAEADDIERVEEGEMVPVVEEDGAPQPFLPDHATVDKFAGALFEKLVKATKVRHVCSSS